MKLDPITEYIIYLQESFIKEFPAVKSFREKNKYIWLYHGTPRKHVSSIKKNGLDPDKSVGHWMVGELRGKKVASFTSVKEYAQYYASRKGLAAIFKKQMGEVLLVKINTNPKDLIFGRSSAGIDEYDYILKVPPKDILFPDNPKYDKIERAHKYLREK